MKKIHFTLIYLVLTLAGISRVTAQKTEDLGIRIQKAEKLIQQSPDSAYLSLKNIYEQAQRSENLSYSGQSLQLMGKISYHLGNYPQALSHYQESMRDYQKIDDRKKEAELLGDIGLLYYYNKRTDQTLAFYTQALHIYKDLKDENGIANILGRIGHLYEKQQQYDSAYVYQERALAIYQKTQNKNGLAKIHENLGSILEDKEQYANAQDHFEQALQLYEETGDMLARIEVINNLGDIYRKTRQYEKAKTQTYRALQIATQMNEHYQMAHAHRDLAKLYHLMGKNDSAYHHMELNRTYSMELYSKENSQQTSFLEVLYDMNEQKKQIEELDDMRRLTYVIGIAAAIIILLIISGQYLKIKAEKKLRQKDVVFFDTQNKLAQAELLNQKLAEENLKKELEIKGKELSSNTLHVINKNQFLENLRTELTEIIKDDKRDNKKQLKQMLTKINLNFNNDKYWEEFRVTFEQVHTDFYEKLNLYAQDLTANDLRLVALLKMNFSSEEIASLLGISYDSVRVARYRLRKKLKLDPQENLIAFLQHL